MWTLAHRIFLEATLKQMYLVITFLEPMSTGVLVLGLSHPSSDSYPARMSPPQSSLDIFKVLGRYD